MSKYIDAEKLKVRITQIQNEHPYSENYESGYDGGYLGCCGELLSLIDSLQQEQPENVVATANALLEALSKTPYNNKPITDAQAIVKQLLVFLKNPSSYNPNAINEQEQPKVDLEDVIENYILENFGERWDGCVPVGCFELDLMAKHFYKLGLKARKEE